MWFEWLAHNNHSWLCCWQWSECSSLSMTRDFGKYQLPCLWFQHTCLPIQLHVASMCSSMFRGVWCASSLVNLCSHLSQLQKLWCQVYPAHLKTMTLKKMTIMLPICVRWMAWQLLDDSGTGGFTGNWQKLPFFTHSMKLPDHSHCSYKHILTLVFSQLCLQCYTPCTFVFVWHFWPSCWKLSMWSIAYQWRLYRSIPPVKLVMRNCP